MNGLTQFIDGGAGPMPVAADRPLPVTSYPAQGCVSTDTGGRQRVSQLTTLFDGKTLETDEPLLWDTVGTGAWTFQDNKVQMSVAAGQYVLRQGKIFAPYFSGKPQFIEPTFDTFAPQPGVVKRVGYGSRSIVAPYTANFDGWYLESSDTIYLVVCNFGTEVLRSPISEWVGRSQLGDYNWDNFTVSLVDFLWLGGAALRLFIKNPDGGFTTADVFDYAGTAKDVFMRNPQQPVFYEIRSTDGSGAFRAICAQVASEGSFSERAKTLSVFTTASVSAAAVGTAYVIDAVRKVAAFRNTAFRVIDVSISSTTVNARGGMLLVVVNPTINGAALTWTNNGRLQEATAAGQTITLGTGRVIAAKAIDVAGDGTGIAESVTAELPVNIDGTCPPIVLAYIPATSNQTVLGTMTLEEY